MVYYLCQHLKIYGFAKMNLLTCRSEAARATFSVFHDTNFFNRRCLTTFENELSDPITLLDFKVVHSMVEQNDFNFTGVIWVNNSSTHVDAMFDSETGAGSYTTIYPWRENNSDTGSYQSSPRLIRNDRIFGAI